MVESNQQCTVVELSDSGLMVWSYDENGETIEETRIDPMEIVDVIESANETDRIQVQHGPDPV